MRDTTELFNLVKSLSMSEKRYISLMAQSHKNDSVNYLLFQALDSMDTYDSEKLRTILKKKSLSGNLAVIKLALHKFIMRCLRNFHSGSSETIGMYEKLIDISILRSKGNVTEVRNLLGKLEKLAMKNRDYYILNMCYMHEKEINYWQLTDEKEIIAFNQRHTEAIDKIYSENMYKNLGNDILFGRR